MITIDKTAELNTSTDTPGIKKGADGTKSKVTDSLIHEHLLEIFVDNAPAFNVSCTPDKLIELITGRLYTSHIINGLTDIAKIFICKKGNVAEVTLTESVQLMPAQSLSGAGREITCCSGNWQLLGRAPDIELSRINPAASTEPSDLASAVFELAEHFAKDSKLHRSTGGTHSCYIRMPDGQIHGFEDISRHNALDKAVGHMLIKGADASECMLYTTGRVPLDMVEKVISSGVPVLISKSVPTDAAVSFAKKHGLTLICRAWPDSYTLYGSS